MSGISDVIVIGLTGQSGAGKTTVCDVFKDNGFTIINADLISRQVMEKIGKTTDRDFIGYFKPY